MKLTILKILDLLKEHRTHLFYILIIGVLLSLSRLNFSSQKESITLESSSSKIDLSKDRDFLTCIYDQLQCYNSNLEKPKNIVYQNCGEIRTCDLKE